MTSIIDPATTTAVLAGDTSTFAQPDYVGSATYPSCALKLKITEPDNNIVEITTTAPYAHTLTKAGDYMYKWSLESQPIVFTIP
jgi:plastocyanin